MEHTADVASGFELDGLTVTETHSEAGVVGRRILAFTVDGVLVAVAVYLAAGSVTRSQGRRAVVMAVGSGVLGIPYHVFLEGLLGQTAGKRLLGIAVRQECGRACTLTAAVVRTLLRFVDWLPAGYCAGFVSIALSDRNQRIGDRCADTVVVRTAERRRDGAGDHA